MKKLFALALGIALLALGSGLSAQTVSGNIAVTIQDKSGAAVPKASVTAVNSETGFTKSGTANEAGELLFSDLPLGSYNITVTAAGFGKQEKTGFPVQLNRTNAATFSLEVQSQSMTVEVSGAAPPINTTTPQIEGTFEARETADLPTAGLNTGSGVINLALLEPGVATSGGVGYGTGPTVGGQRPTNNSFTVEGVDNNALSVTGPVVGVPNDAVAEFSALQNNYNPEFGHSNGGQFNQTIKSGTNTIHGAAYEYALNRKLDATDQNNIVAGADPQRPRFDNNRFGGDVGGPIIKDKLFFFALGEYNPFGQAATVAGGLCSPTAAGYAALAALPAGPNPGPAGGNIPLSMTNLGQFQKYLAPSPTSGTCASTKGNPSSGALTNPDYLCTGGAIPAISPGGVTCSSGNPVAVDVGVLPVAGPNYTNVTNLVFSGDYNMSTSDQFRVRYIYNKINGINFAADLPVFYSLVPIRNHLVAINEYHTFRPDLTNELRLGFNRTATDDPVGSQIFPGLGVFPNLQFSDLNLQVGPNTNFPQFNVQNVYQLSDNLNWSHRNHNVRVGVDTARYIAPSSFTQRSRGDYQYTSLGTYLYDINPDILAERSSGSHIYYSDQIVSGVYFNDTWRIRPSISFNYGMRYEYGTIPFGERAQALNAAASIPGLIDFSEPRAPKNQFMPRAGFAWSPDKNRTWSVRGGIFMGYDVAYDNLGTLSFPPQFSSTQDRPQGAVGIINNFLANGGIPAGTGGLATFQACMTPTPNCGIFGSFNTALALQQTSTSAQVPVNFHNPVAVAYSLGVQHEFGKSYTLEVRYLGTHGYHLPVQTQLNKQSAISPTNFLPTFLTTPSAATLGALTTTRASLTANPLAEYVPAFVAGCAGAPGASATTDGLLADGVTPAPCFANNVTSFQFEGNSVYHGLATQLTRRFEHGLQLNASYTYSHAIDDSTAAVFSTVITPRRPQNFQDVANDRSNSALDHRHRLTIEAYYDLPYFKSGSWWRRNVLGNWFFTPVFTYQSGGWGDPQAALDANLNGDTAGDRVLFNPAGIGNTGTGTTATCLIGGAVVVGSSAAGKCNAANTVAYTANSSTARYIRTGQGGLEPSNGLLVNGRNTLPLRPIDSVDITIGKKFNVTERARLEFQAQFFNFLNHPQYIPGSLDDVVPVTFTGNDSKNYLTPSSATFNRPDLTFSSNPRLIQLVAKLVF